MILLFLNCIHFLFRIKSIYSTNMSSIKVVDINEEAKQEPTPEIIEEAKEEVKEEVMEEAKDEVIKEEQAMEENKENIQPSKEETEDLKNNSKTERLKDKKSLVPNVARPCFYAHTDINTKKTAKVSWKTAKSKQEQYQRHNQRQNQR